MEIKAEEAGKPVSELPVSFYIGLKRGTFTFFFVRKRKEETHVFRSSGMEMELHEGGRGSNNSNLQHEVFSFYKLKE